MKALVFADLHIGRSDSPQFTLLQHHVKRQRPDIVLIAGDVCESQTILKSDYNPFEQLDSLGVPVVFCLGNHEFAYQSVSQTLKLYKERQKNSKNVHCLDIEGRFEYRDLIVVGNVLWYDGSLCSGRWSGYIVSSWLDSTIKEFDPVKENSRCVRQIQENLGHTDGKKRILLTHCVPQKILNAHQTITPSSPYNTYSGMDHLLEEIPFDYAYCGHTHRPAEAVINGCRAVNIGNDYLHSNPYNVCFRFLVEEF